VKNHPSNRLLYVMIAIMILFVAYIFGSLLLEARQEVREELEVSWKP
jgi:hypothetical protein